MGPLGLVAHIDELVQHKRFRSRSQAIERALAGQLRRWGTRIVARILRGEIRWANLSPTRGREQSGHRPVLVLSHDVFNERSDTAIVVAMTSQEPRAGFPLTLESAAAGLPKRSWVKISQIRTVSTERIGQRLARASEEELARVLEGLDEIIG